MSTSGSKSNEHVAHFLVDIHNLGMMMIFNQKEMSRERSDVSLDSSLFSCHKSWDKEYLVLRQARKRKRAVVWNIMRETR